MSAGELRQGRHGAHGNARRRTAPASPPNDEESQKSRQSVNHYSFHIVDPTWGHVTIRMSGHPPFSAQVILNGHEYVACAARSAKIGFRKEGNCFIPAGDPKRLAQDRRHLPPTRGHRAPEPVIEVDPHRLRVLRTRSR